MQHLAPSTELPCCILNKIQCYRVRQVYRMDVDRFDGFAIADSSMLVFMSGFNFQPNDQNKQRRMN